MDIVISIYLASVFVMFFYYTLKTIEDKKTNDNFYDILLKSFFWIFYETYLLVRNF
jgi:hypothetical protein